MLIEIEGVAGVGKTTLIETLCTMPDLIDATIVDAAAHERRADEAGELIGTFMRNLTRPLDSGEAVFLYCARTAARARVIATLKRKRAIVLSDRFRLSLLVQARLAGLTSSRGEALVLLATRGIQPAHTILLDADHNAHWSRVMRRNDVPLNRLDHERLRTHFVNAYRRTSGMKTCIDTSGMHRDQVVQVVARIIRRLAG